jgi:hypothetical protein
MEYNEVAHYVAKWYWIRQFLDELDQPLDVATMIFCDNVSTVFTASNLAQHLGTKHIEIDIHFVREKVSLG